MSQKKVYPAKDPSERLPYGFNWTPRNIGGEVLTTTTAQVISGTITIHSSAVGEVPGARIGQGTVYDISGGAAGEMCEILLEAKNADESIILQQTVYLPIREK